MQPVIREVIFRPNIQSSGEEERSIKFHEKHAYGRVSTLDYYILANESFTVTAVNGNCLVEGSCMDMKTKKGYRILINVVNKSGKSFDI
jgi:hypothetical protein